MKPSAQPFCDRKCFKIDRDVYRMDQIIRVNGQETGYDATGSYWVIGYIEIHSGSLFFLVDRRRVRAPGRRFVMVMPPQSVVSVILNNAATINSAAFSCMRIPKGLPKEPIAFAAEKALVFRTFSDVEDLLERTYAPIKISRSTRPHSLSQRAKDILGNRFQENVSLSFLARRFKTSPSVLCRYFKSDWGKSPVNFRNFLRILDSFRHIAEGEAIVETAYDVGFNDLSRFHKQFKKTVGRTPLSVRKNSQKTPRIELSTLA